MSYVLTSGYVKRCWCKKYGLSFILYHLNKSRIQIYHLNWYTTRNTVNYISVNPHSSKQITHSHLNVITTQTRAKHVFSINQCDTLYYTCELDFWSVMFPSLNSAASFELFHEPSHEVLPVVVGVDLQVDKPHTDAAKGTKIVQSLCKCRKF